MKNQIPVKKNEEYIVEIIDNGFEGEGIAKIDGYTTFIPGAIKGEKCKILILKTTASHAFAKIVEVIETSPIRKEVDCKTYQRCGGCSLRHIQYEATLEMKQNMVQNLVNKTLAKPVVVEKTIGMEQPYYYRNKAQYPVGVDKTGNPIVGIFAQRTHEIIPMEHCFIQNPISEILSKVILTYIKEKHIEVYDEEKRKGLIRHIVIKIGVKTKQVMCVLVVNGEKIPQEQRLVEFLLQEFQENPTLKDYQLKTVVKNVNTKNTNVILGEKNVILYGEGYIEDQLGEYIFKISPMSFYQTNPRQTEVLYQNAIEFAELKGNEVLLDLYCGIGTIGIFASKKAKKVYGIEIVPDAIRDANENAKLNHIENIEFLCGDVEITLEKVLAKSGTPDVVFVDPPRRGLDNTTIENMLKVQPAKIIYISCNPATMVRDLKLLEEKYTIKKIQPVDMFPFTSHVECVSVLKLK
ncbi:MAG: 23S rRNA (uracil(1939)-C(5))-methyltransferase RlmD [Clostridia bacterium]|nr:23S rRNA (uracil(1939)-C(5))-methyltransferase RlmD [Clostridia bacterium]